jgi:hypothetical protein
MAENETASPKDEVEEGMEHEEAASPARWERFLLL